MTEAQWKAATDPRPMVDFIGRKTSGRKLRLLVVAACRRYWDKLGDARSRTAVEVAERFADGLASQLDMIQASDAAYAAIDDCPDSPLVLEELAISASLTAAHDIHETTEGEPGTYQPLAMHALHYTWDGDDLRASFNQNAILLRDIFGNPFRPVSFDPAWRTSTVVALAQQMYDGRDFALMPILGDALQDAGCDHADILDHCRSAGPHVRGCWVVDLVLGKE